MVRWKQDSFIKRVDDIFPNCFIFEKTVFNGVKKEVVITCKKHGDFIILADNLLRGHGCSKCGREGVTKKLIKPYEQFVLEARKEHSDEYDYSFSDYKGAHYPILIKHKQCGLIFKQTPNHHVCGNGCPHCFGKCKYTNKTYANKASKVHHNYYDYSEVHINGIYSTITPICPVHGKFEVNAASHLQGSGCPLCKQNKSKLENEISKFLDKNCIKYIQQASKKDLPWLGFQSLDFYLPDYNVAIECQGIQHFKSIPYFGGESKFTQITKLDKKKKMKCVEHGVSLLYYSNLNLDYPYFVYEDKDELLKDIINEKKYTGRI